MQLGASVDGRGLESGCTGGVSVFQAIDGAVGVMLQTPCSAEVDNLDALRDSVRSPFARLLVRRGKKQDFDSGVGDALPVEGENFMLLLAGRRELRVEIFKIR